MSIDPSALHDARELLRRKTTRIAVVGASNDPSKYGNIIVRTLVRHGYDVVPVNLRETTIAGLRVYPNLRAIPSPVDIVDVVTPPESTLEILREAAEAGISLVWLQDGSHDEAALRAAAAAPFKTVHGACIMVEARGVHPVP